MKMMESDRNDTCGDDEEVDEGIACGAVVGTHRQLILYKHITYT
jgi:hypothetical protein